LQGESRILDAPNIRNDYYANIMDWGKNNILAVALGSKMYLWNSDNSNVTKLFNATGNDFPTSVSWSEDTKYLSVGFKSSKLELWDAETSKPVCFFLFTGLLKDQQVVNYTLQICADNSVFNFQIRILEGHGERIATIAWNGHILTSGSHDKYILNHDGNILFLSTLFRY